MSETEKEFRLLSAFNSFDKKVTEVSYDCSEWSVIQTFTALIYHILHLSNVINGEKVE